MRIAVIGGTGVVGHHTVEALRRAGHDIVVVARSHGVNFRGKTSLVFKRQNFRKRLLMKTR